MPSDFNKIIYALPKFYRSNYATLMKTLENIHNFDTSDIAQFRFHVLQHFYHYGLSSTMNAFSVKRSTLYDWKKSYEDSSKRLSSLIPRSTRPKKTREMMIDWRLTAFIKSFREQYGNISGYKIKPFLDEYAKNINIHTYSIGKIGKIIRRKNYFFEGRKKTRKKKPFGKRLTKAPREKDPGYIEMDTVVIYCLGEKYYFMTAIDVVSKTAWCRLSRSHSSRHTTTCLKEFQREFQSQIRVIQTDNGTEFMVEFEQYLQKERIEHRYIYYKSPKINGVVERFNRTIQEECLNRHYDLLYDTQKIKKKLREYLLWYNMKRPHYALKYKTPLQYLEEIS